jgi:hypothetical protein
VHLQLPGRRRRVDALSKGHEGDAEGLKLLEQHHQVLQAPSKSVEAPHDQHVDATPPGRRDQIVECGTAILGAGDAAVNEIDGGPAACVGVPV